MALLLGVAFFIVPFVEMLVIFAVAPRLGFDTTVTLLVLFSALGAWLVKREGLGTWRRIQSGLQAGRMPTADAVDGFLVLVSGTLLLCPGFVTSAFGLLLILPPVRSRSRDIVGASIRLRVSRRIRTVGSRLNEDPVNARSQTGAAAGGSPFATPHRAYRRPDETETESNATPWGARVRRGPIDDVDVIDLDGEEIVFGQGELGPSGF